MSNLGYQTRIAAAVCALLTIATTAYAQAPVYASTFRFDVNGGGVSYPNAATIDSKGRVIVANSGQHAVEVYALDAAQQQYVVVARYGTPDAQPRWIYTYTAPADGATSDEIMPSALDPASGCEVTPGLTPRLDACLASPQGVAVDAQDRIFVTDSGNYRVLVFKSADAANLDADGRLQLLDTFGRFGGAVIDVCPCAAGPNGAPAATDVLFEEATPPGPGQFAAPWDIAVYRNASGGPEVFVLDQVNNQVQGFRFDAAARTFTQFVAFGHRGDEGSDPQGWAFPSGIGIDQRNGNLVVADSGKRRALVYTYPFSSATWAAEITTAGTGGNGQPVRVFGTISGYVQQGDVAFDNAHRIFILDSVDASIHVFAQSGSTPSAGYAFQFTLSKTNGSGPGELNDPLGIDLVQPNDTLSLEDDLGQMVIADTYTGRIQVFQPARLSVAAVNFDSPTAGLDGTPITGTITVKNTGALTIVGVSPTLSGFTGLISPAADSIVVSPAQATVAPGQPQEFKIALKPQSPGVLNLQVGASGITADPDRQAVTVSPLFAAPAVNIGCAGSPNPLVVKTATSDASAAQTGGSIVLHVTLQNCSPATLQALPDVRLSGVPVTLNAAAAPLALAPAGQPASTMSWTLTYTAGTTGGDAIFTVSGKSADGGITAAGSLTVTVTISTDVTPPTSRITIVGLSDPSGLYYRGRPLATLHATDDRSGIAAINCSYTIGSVPGARDCSPVVTGNPTTFDAGAPFELPDGQITLTYYAVDAAHHEELPHNVKTLNIDNRPPTVTWTVSPVPNAAGWNNTQTTAVFNAVDPQTQISTVVSQNPLQFPLAPGATSFLLNDPDAILDPAIVATDAAGNQTASDQIVKIDRLPPIVDPSRNPPANAGGWNNSLPVTVSWNIYDPPPPTCPRGDCQVSGLKSVGTVTCATAACQPVQVPSPTVCPGGACAAAGPTTISTQGRTHVIAAACDVADNCRTIDAEVKVGPIQVDVTPPESYNVFDVATKNNLVFARDDFSGVPSTPVTPTLVSGWWLSSDDTDDDGNDHVHDNTAKPIGVYGIADAAGNTQMLAEKIHAAGNEVHVAVIGFVYTTGCPTKCVWAMGMVPDGTGKKFEWSTNKDGSLTLVQNMTIGRGKTRTHIRATYDGAAKQTTIVSDVKNPLKTTLSGIVLLRMATRSGGLVIEYTNPITNQVVIFAP